MLLTYLKDSWAIYLVDTSSNLPEGQAIKLAFFAPCLTYGVSTNNQSGEIISPD